VLTIPYIHRDDEQVILDHLTARRPVLPVGTSMIGETWPRPAPQQRDGQTRRTGQPRTQESRGGQV
jgi:hypothetical protein